MEILRSWGKVVEATAFIVTLFWLRHSATTLGRLLGSPTAGSGMGMSQFLLPDLHN